MNDIKRFNNLKGNSKRIDINIKSKIVIFSDCHRGDGTYKDALYPNVNIYLTALRYYYNEGYTYIEVGDGDELWKFKRISDIFDAHRDEYNVLNDFKKKNKLHMIYGNHDSVKSKKRFKRRIVRLREKRNKLYEFYRDLDIVESITLKYHETKDSSRDYILFHGHQFDFFNYELLEVSKYLVRHVWTILNGVFSVKEPTSPARSDNRREKVDKRVLKLSKEENESVIIGHTHRTMFPKDSEPQYFNIGAGVLPYTVTCIEISNGVIVLVKWIVTADGNGALVVRKEVVGGPKSLI